MAAVSCRDPYVTVSLKRKTVVCVPKNGTGTMHSPEALAVALLYGTSTRSASNYCTCLKAAKKQLRRGLSSPQKVSARITESLNNIGTTECHAIRNATLSEVLFWDNFDSISYVMPTSRPVPSATRTVHWCRTVLYSRSRHHELAPPPAYRTHRAPPYLRQVRSRRL